MKTTEKAGCFIGTSWGTGAVPSYFLALGRELAARGMRVKLIVAKAEGQPPGSIGDVGIENWPSKRPTRLADALFLSKLIRRYRPRLLLANFAAVNWMCVVGWLLQVKHRIAFYHTLNAQIDMDAQNMSRPNRELLKLRKRFVYGLATNLVSNSVAALQDLQSTYRVPSSKCAVQYLGIADPTEHIPIVPAEAKEDSILCVGRFHPSKGQDILIDAIAILGTSVNGTRFHFVGAGPSLEALRRRAAARGVANRCVFEGAIAHKDILARMSRAKAVAVTSRAEAFGLVNIEAMSVATPVIASRVGGIPEIVRDGIDGFLFSAGDARALSDRLNRLLSDASLRQSMGSNARERFLHEFEVGKATRQHANFLENLIAASMTA